MRYAFEQLSLKCANDVWSSAESPSAVAEVGSAICDGFHTEAAGNFVARRRLVQLESRFLAARTWQRKQVVATSDRRAFVLFAFHVLLTLPVN